MVGLCRLAGEIFTHQTDNYLIFQPGQLINGDYLGKGVSVKICKKKNLERTFSQKTKLYMFINLENDHDIYNRNKGNKFP